MSIETIKTLIHEFNDSNLTKLKLNYEDFEIELEKSQELSGTQVVAVQPVTTQFAPVATAEVNINTGVAPEAKQYIKSPMVGTFYTASSPDSKPFASVGDHVKKGDVVCIVEAMKLMNEVEAEIDGEIVEILVKNEEMVEFDQPLFVIK